jgi:hypothetical protein
VSQDDPFGVPPQPPGFDLGPPEVHPLASGDESVLAASGLTAPADQPRNKVVLIAIGAAVLLVALAIAAAAGAFRTHHKTPTVVAPSHSASPSASVPVPSVTPSTAAPKPKPPALRPLAGKAQTINKANSGTLGKPYAVTLPTGWTVARGIRNDAVGNLDLRMRNAAKTHSLSILTLKPAVVTGPIDAAKLAAVKAALFKGDTTLKSLPGVPKARVAGSAATGFDVTTVSAGQPITARILVWQRDGVTYAVSWRVSTPLFARSMTTYAQLLASVKFAA